MGGWELRQSKREVRGEKRGSPPTIHKIQNAWAPIRLHRQLFSISVYPHFPREPAVTAKRGENRDLPKARRFAGLIRDHTRVLL